MRAVLLTVLLIGGAVVSVSATVGTGIPAIDDPIDEFTSDVASTAGPADGSANPTGSPKLDGDTWGRATATPTRYAMNQPTPTPAPTTELQPERVEQLIHAEINDRRAQQDLPPLHYDESLEEVADYHSRDMATNRYFAHTAPDGETLADRYGRFDIDCSYSGENIAYTYWKEPIQGGDYHDSNRDLATGIVNQWMNSSGHRANILRPQFEAEGLGVYRQPIDGEGTRVYATQNFC